MADRTPFEVLGLAPDAEPVAIEAVYRALARRYHPDANPGVAGAELQARMVELNWAHDELAQDLEGWRRRAMRGRGGSGLNWEQRPARPAEPPVWNVQPRRRGNGLNWGPRTEPPREREFVELEWHRRRGRPGGEAPPVRGPRSPRSTPLQGLIRAEPRVLNLPGQRGATGTFLARIEGVPGAHVQARFRAGPFEIRRRGGQGPVVGFEVTVVEDVRRPSHDPVIYDIDLVARGCEGARLLLALQPQPLPPGAPWPPRRRPLDELRDSDLGLIRWV